MKRSVTVQIAGQKYTLRSDAEEDRVRALAAFVDGLCKDVQKQTRAADTQAVAILTALRIAEELFGERRGDGGPQAADPGAGGDASRSAGARRRGIVTGLPPWRRAGLWSMRSGRSAG